MKTKILFTLVVLAIIAVGGYYLWTPNQQTAVCTNYDVVALNRNERFQESYTNGELKDIPERKFIGILQEREIRRDVDTTVMRELPYGIYTGLPEKPVQEIYVTAADLSEYVGKEVTLTGKRYQFSLEGTSRDEIWPVSITCSNYSLK